MDDIWKQLAEPFSEEEIEWLIVASIQDKSSSLVAPYLKAHSIMDRLDEVVGPANWTDSYEAGPSGGVMCVLSIRADNDIWVDKSDVSENTENEPIKGGVTGAFKRAAVRWGIGRYLARVPQYWVGSTVRGKRVVLTEYPRIPPQFLPGGVQGPPPAQQPEPPHDEKAAPGALSDDSGPVEAENVHLAAADWFGRFGRLHVLMDEAGVKPGDIATVIKGGYSEEGIAAYMRKNQLSLKQLVAMAVAAKPKTTARAR